MVCMKPRPKGVSTRSWSSQVMAVASTMTNVTAAPIPVALESLRDTPINGQMPRNWANTMLLTKIAVMMMEIYSSI